MKIALFVHCFYPEHFYGTETYTLELARHLRAIGHEVTVVTAVFAGEPEAETLISDYSYEGVPVIRIDKNRFPNLSVRDTYYQPLFSETLRGVVKRLAPDLIHVTHLINHTAALLEVAKQESIPVIATLTDFFGFCLNNKLQTSAGELCAGPNAQRTNCLACYLKDAAEPHETRPVLQWISDRRRVRATAKLLNAAVRLPPLRATSIDRMVQDVKDRPGVLHKMYEAYAALITPTLFLQQAYRANGFGGTMHNMWFGVDLPATAKPQRAADHLLQIGFIGQIAEHKGIDLLVDAFTMLPQGSAELLVYGRRDQSPALTAQLEARAAGYPVRFMDTFAPSEISSVLDRLDLLVIPSRWYENSPLVLLNALARHTPVIVADVAGLTEFVEPGVNGLHFQRGSAVALSRQLRKFVDGTYDAAQMSLKTNYLRTTRSMAEEVVEIYREVIRSAKRTLDETDGDRMSIHATKSKLAGGMQVNP